MGRADAGLRGVLRSHLGHIGQWVTIETGGTEGGVPDSNVFIKKTVHLPGRDVWIECKATTAFAVKFKPAQVGWLFTRWRLGGVAFIATRRMNETRQGATDELYVTSAEHVMQLSRYGLTSVPHLLVASGGPGQWPWVKVENVLRHMR
jgi:hypothetical protein